MTSKKREVIPLPINLTPAERVCFCINIPNDPEHFAAFWGALDALTHRYSWGKPLTSDSAIIATYWRGIIQDNRDCFEEVIKMANKGCGCFGVPAYRYDVNGIKQVSTDGGQTWQTDLTDPRNYGSILPPPIWLVPAGDHSCEGATVARNNIELLFDQILNVGFDIGLPAFIEAIAALFCAMSGGLACGLVQLLAGICTLLLQIGKAVIEAELTPAAYDTLKCIFFCHIEQDASFTEAGWQAVKLDITQQFTGDLEFVFWNTINALGASGLTNFARLAITVTANCDECVCECSDPVLGNIGNNLIDRSDLGVGWWQVTLEDSEDPENETNGRFFAQILLPGCCFHHEYVAVPPAIEAPVGNRLSSDCEHNIGTGNYGINGCMEWILFRGYGADTYQFRIGDC